MSTPAWVRRERHIRKLKLTIRILKAERLLNTKWEVKK